MTQAQAAMVSIGDDGALDTEIRPWLAEIWTDRDLSWLDFNQRVLAEATDSRTPVLRGSVRMRRSTKPLYSGMEVGDSGLLRLTRDAASRRCGCGTPWLA